MTRANELTIEELLGIVTTDGTTISNLRDDKSNTAEYIREQGITDGNFLVPNYVIYYNYRKDWRPQGKKLSKIGFLRKFSVVFESHRKTNVRYYLLEPDPFDLTEQGLARAKDFDLRYRNKIKRKRDERNQRI